MCNLHRNNKIFNRQMASSPSARRLLLAGCPPALLRTRCRRLDVPRLDAPPLAAHALLAAIGIRTRIAALLVAAQRAGVARLRLLAAETTVSGGFIVGTRTGTISARIVVAWTVRTCVVVSRAVIAGVVISRTIVRVVVIPGRCCCCRACCCSCCRHSRRRSR